MSPYPPTLPPSLSPVLPAMAAGNCVVIKPSEIAGATAQAIAELLPKYLDSKAVKVRAI